MEIQNILDFLKDKFPSTSYEGRAFELKWEGEGTYYEIHTNNELDNYDVDEDDIPDEVVDNYDFERDMESILEWESYIVNENVKIEYEIRVDADAEYDFCAHIYTDKNFNINRVIIDVD